MTPVTNSARELSLKNDDVRTGLQFRLGAALLLNLGEVGRVDRRIRHLCDATMVRFRGHGHAGRRPNLNAFSPVMSRPVISK